MPWAVLPVHHLSSAGSDELERHLDASRILGKLADQVDDLREALLGRRRIDREREFAERPAPSR